MSVDAARSPQTITHETVLPPIGVAPARIRPPRGASSAPQIGLDGEWRFRLFDHADTGTACSERGDDWGRIAVPGHWQLAGAPSAWPHGAPEYSNKLFPFPIEPPFVPDDNPTGEYRLPFEMPSDWPSGGSTVLRFEGVDSWFRVALNGVVIAHSHGSRLPTEIDLTPHLRPGENLLAVRVTKWSALSYIEDQDQWWLSGIFRSVSIEHRPDGAVQHIDVHADFDPETRSGTLTVGVESTAAARIRVPELGIDIAAGETATAVVEPWSAELPRLYDLIISTAGETVTLAVGFRRIDIVDGVFRVNGRAITLRGVNRHEFDPLRGRSVTDERMLEDVLLMKRHNVNAVRTSHYPPHPHFLDLCDRYGLYVIDENDLETHGFENIGWVGNPVDDPEWTDVLLDRVTRMVRRDAHHPSIIMWSLGNEAGRGRNIALMASAVRALDPSRPLHYEGDYSSDEVDVYSRMYATSEETELIGQRNEAPLARADLDARRRAMPFLQCEYAHAMGNGPGGLADYDAIIDRYPRLLGGFIWEWIDHGLLREDTDGTPYSAYGGDFGEKFHDGTFVADGLLLPDRTPSPSLLEAAAVFAPLRLDPQDDGSLLVRNRYAFRDTAHVSLEWTQHRGDEVLATGVLPLSLASGQATTLRPPADLVVPAPGGAPVWWTVRAVQTTPHPLEEAWLTAPFVIAQGQLLMQDRAPLAAATGRATAHEHGGYRVAGAEIDSRGRLRRLLGREVSEFRVDAWRAPTDNDRRSGMWRGPSDAALWRSAGLHLLAERTTSVELTGTGSVVVTARTAGPTTDCALRTRYEWRPVAENSDAVDLLVDIEPEGRWTRPHRPDQYWPEVPWPVTVARLGVLLVLDEPDAAALDVRWHGLGPDESYADSRAAALGGSYRHSLPEWQTDYTHPQENGARRGVTHAQILRADGTGLRLDAGRVLVAGNPQPGLELSLRPWSDEHLDAARHPHDLVPDGRLRIHLDAVSHGVGSAACGPGVLPNAQLHPAPVRLELRLQSV